MFGFNAIPLVPPGTKVLIHENPGTRGSWAVRAINGWYTNRVKDHYRCYKIIPEKTKKKCISDTVECFPHGCAMTFREASENATIALNKLVHTLKYQLQHHLFGKYQTHA